MEQDNTQLKILPAPVGGWNARDPLHAMPETDAFEMVNFFPESASIVPRGGCTNIYQEAFVDIKYVYDLFALPSQTVGAAGRLMALLDDGSVIPNVLYEINISTGAKTDISPTGISVYKDYQTTIFRGKLFACNGTGDPWHVGSTGSAAATAWTGSGLTISNLINVDSYKGRLYFVEKNTANIWYGALDGITGALTKYDISSFLTLGGSLIAVATTTKQSGNLNQNCFVAISSLGEVLVFSGDWPGSSTWNLIGRFITAPILGYKGVFYRGANLHLITADGIVPIGSLLNNDMVNDKYRSISDKIQNAFRELADTWVEWGRVSSWSATYSHSHRMMIINPSAEISGVMGFDFPVQNTETQAWASFDLPYVGITSFVELDGELYFSNTTGGTTWTSGGIWRLERPNEKMIDDESDCLSSDQPTPVQAYFRQAYNLLDDIANQKHITAVKGFFTADVGDTLPTYPEDYGIYLNGLVDFEAAWDDPTKRAKFTVAADGSYSQVIHLPLQGTAFSLCLYSKLMEHWELEYRLAIIAYETGGFLC